MNVSIKMHPYGKTKRVVLLLKCIDHGCKLVSFYPTLQKQMNDQFHGILHVHVEKEKENDIWVDVAYITIADDRVLNIGEFIEEDLFVMQNTTTELHGHFLTICSWMKTGNRPLYPSFLTWVRSAYPEAMTHYGEM